MEDLTLHKIREEKLKKCINDLREILYETLTHIDSTELWKEQIIVSECLDKIIFEYMNITKDNK